MQCGEDLGRGLALEVGVVEVRVEADQNKGIPLRDDILVSVIEVEPVGSHGGGDGGEIHREDGPEGNLGVNEQVGDELIQGGGMSMATEDDANGMERKMADRQQGAVHARNEAEGVLRFGLGQEVFEPDVRIEEVHRPSPPTIPGPCAAARRKCIAGSNRPARRPSPP